MRRRSLVGLGGGSGILGSGSFDSMLACTSCYGEVEVIEGEASKQ